MFFPLLFIPLLKQSPLTITDESNNFESSLIIPTSRNSKLLENGRNVNHFNNHHRHNRSVILRNISKDKYDIPVNESSSTSSIIPFLQIILPLLFVYISNQWSRSSIYYLVDFSQDATPFQSMNVDLQFTETQYGLLASVAFTSLFAIASILGGSLADKWDRKLLTIGSTLLWSIALFFTAYSTTFYQLVLARIFMGLSCAFTTPAAYTYIRDKIPPNISALANSIYSSGVYIGGFLSSLSILMDEKVGWRQTCLIIAFYGLFATSIVSFFLPKDVPTITSLTRATTTHPEISNSNDRIKTKKENYSSIFLPMQEILASKTTQLLYASSLARFSAGLSIGVWSATYFRMTFPDSSESFAIKNAIIVGFCGCISSFVGGSIADEASRYALRLGMNENSGRLFVPVLGSLLAAPAWFMTMQAQTFDQAIIWLSIQYLLAESWFGPVVSVLQSKVRNETGGTAQGLFMLAAALGNILPSLIGAIYSESINSTINSTLALSSLLSVCIGTAYILSAIGFTLTSINCSIMDKKQ